MDQPPTPSVWRCYYIYCSAS